MLASRQLLLVPLLIAAVSSGIGCTMMQPTALDITPTGVQVDRQHKATVAVEVVGGAESGAISAPNEEVRQAVLAAIRESGVFDIAPVGGTADYALDVVIGRVHLPFVGGMEVTATVEMIWNVANASKQKTIWQSVIETSASGGTEVAMNAQTRCALVTGRAMGQNIREALARLSAADL